MKLICVEYPFEVDLAEGSCRRYYASLKEAAFDALSMYLSHREDEDKGLTDKPCSTQSADVSLETVCRLDLRSFADLLNHNMEGWCENVEHMGTFRLVPQEAAMSGGLIILYEKNRRTTESDLLPK